MKSRLGGNKEMVGNCRVVNCRVGTVRVGLCLSGTLSSGKLSLGIRFDLDPVLMEKCRCESLSLWEIVE